LKALLTKIKGKTPPTFRWLCSPPFYKGKHQDYLRLSD